MSYDLTNKNIQDTFQNVLQRTGSDNRLYDLTGKAIGDLRITGSLTAEQYIVSSSVTNIAIATLSGSTAFGNTSDDTHIFIGDISASGNISASAIYADTIYTSGSTLYVGSQAFTQAHLTDLKQGKSIRDLSGLSTTTYTLEDGRTISREYESRFNRWAPNINYTGQDSTAEYSETDFIPQTHVDLTDRGFRSVVQGGKTKFIQSATKIILSYSADSTTKINIKSPNINFTSGRGDNETRINITGSLNTSGNISSNGTVAMNVAEIGGGTFTSASLASAGADNLGDHTATQDLNLNGNDIYGVQHITASGDISASGLLLNTTNATEDFFLLKSGSVDSLKVNGQGVVTLGEFMFEPTAVNGGVYYNRNDDEFYLGKN